MTASGTGAPSPSMTRPSIAIFSPAGLSDARSLHSGRAIPRWKKGPTVCEGVGISLSAIFVSDRIGRGPGAAAQHQVEAVAERPFGFAQHGVVLRDQPLARTLIRGALEDRVVAEQRVAREVHLGHQPRHKAGSEDAEMDMRRAPRIGAVAPGIGAGLDRQKAIAAIRPADHLAGAGEIGVERCVVLVDRVVIAPGRVALPELDEGARYRSPR